MAADKTEPKKYDFKFRVIDQTMRFSKVNELVYNRSREQAPVIDKQLTEAAPKAKMTDSVVTGWHFDLFNAVYQHKASLSGFGDELVRDIMKRIQDTEKFHELRAFTVTDELASCLSAVTLTVELAEKLPEEVKKKADAARKAKEAAEKAAAAAKAAAENPDATDEQKQDAADEAADKDAAAKAAAIALRQSLRNNGQAIRQAIAGGLEKASGDAESLQAASRCFGSGSFDTSGGLPPAEKFRLAQVIAKSGEGFRLLCKLLGRMTSEALQKQAAKMKHEAGAIADIVLGSQIPDMLEDELAQLHDPKLKVLQLAKIAQDAAMIYEVEQKEPEAKGDMVILLDESGSMAGQKEAEAKGVALALAQVCFTQKRRFVCHFFQDSVTFTVEIHPKDRYATDPKTGLNVALTKLQQIALRGTAGGTSFDRPLAQAVKTVRDGGLDKADVLTITDGECDVSDATLKSVGKLRDDTGCRVYTMLVGVGGGSTTATVKKFSDKVWNCDSLLKGAASELFDLV